jgi:MYXO-CTERM domain-containing protein
MKLSKTVIGGATLALLFVAGQAAAVELISNYPGNDGSQTAGINASTRTKGMGFAMPAGVDYFLDEIVLRLGITDTAVKPVVELYTDAGGPGTPLTTLVDPGGYVLGIGDYSFTPAGDFVLEADTNYWIVASAANDINVYDWKASSPSEVPTGIATHIGATFGTYPPQNSSSILVTYFMNGTPVPAPGSFALLGVGALALRRRR